MTEENNAVSNSFLLDDDSRLVTVCYDNIWELSCDAFYDLFIFIMQHSVFC